MAQACGCDSTDVEEKGRKDGYVYYVCKTCGNAFGVPDKEAE